MTQLIVAYHSGYGHTKRLADAAVNGAAGVAGVSAQALDVGSIDEAGWDALNASDAIIFASPTYMGGVSAPFKKFVDDSAGAWFKGAWRDKVAGGMTLSNSPSGDKVVTIQYMITVASQHGMIWVSTGMMPGKNNPEQPEINRLGGFTGVLAETDNAPPEETPPAGDLETARLYGARVAQVAQKLRG